MAQPGPSTTHFPTYSYAYSNGQLPLSPLPKQLFAPPSDSYATHSNPQSLHHPHPYPHAHKSPSPPPQPQPDAKPLVNHQRGEWAIWSRRPEDPSHAPGVIISPNAKPPPYVIELALELPTPPLSPIISTQDLVEHEQYIPPLSSVYASEPQNELDHEALPEPTISSTVPSSNVTEATGHDTPAAASPDTSATSLSASADLLTTKSEHPVSYSSASDSASTLPEPTNLESSTLPAATTPQKKSWASLLQTSNTSSSLPPGQKRLPTSSVVGISVPASIPIFGSSTPPSRPPFSHPALALPHSKRTELLNLLTAAPDSAGASKIRPRGLINAGNMCFANSVLQVLVYCPPFYRLFTELARYGFGSRPSSEKEGKGPMPLVDAMVEFVREFSEGLIETKTGGRGSHNGKGKERDESRGGDEVEGGSFLPSYVFDAMKEKTVFDGMRSGQQEDAEEFLGFFLDALEEELLAVVHALSGSPGPSTVQKKGRGKSSTKKDTGGVEEKEGEEEKEDGWLEVGKRNRMVVTRTIKAAETPITRIFGGKVRSTLKNPGQKDSVTLEAWRALRLDIQPENIHTLTDALTHMSAPQMLELDSAHHASIQHLLEALPPVLVLHLKRFCYDKDVEGVVKIGKGVSWGEGLEIGGDVMAPPLRRGPPTRYKLFGVLYHHGQSASGGHYTLDVLHPARNSVDGWMRIDDELVSDVRSNDVFAPDHEEEGKAAYLLFYRRVL